MPNSGNEATKSTKTTTTTGDIDKEDEVCNFVAKLVLCALRSKSIRNRCFSSQPDGCKRIQWNEAKSFAVDRKLSELHRSSSIYLCMYMPLSIPHTDTRTNVLLWISHIQPRETRTLTGHTYTTYIQFTLHTTHIRNNLLAVFIMISAMMPAGKQRISNVARELKNYKKTTRTTKTTTTPAKLLHNWNLTLLHLISRLYNMYSFIRNAKPWPC